MRKHSKSLSKIMGLQAVGIYKHQLAFLFAGYGDLYCFFPKYNVLLALCPLLLVLNKLGNCSVWN